MTQLLYLLALSCLTLLTSCGSLGSTHKFDNYQHELTLHKMRADIEEIKHDLHTYRMQLNIADGKMLNHEDLLTSIKKDALENHEQKLDKYQQQIALLEKKITLSEKKQEELHLQIQKLLHEASETHKALAQYKEKFHEFEQNTAHL